MGVQRGGNGGGGGCKQIKGVNLRWPCKVEAENVVVVRLKWVARWGTWVMRALMDFINIITSCLLRHTLYEADTVMRMITIYRILEV